MPHARLLFTLLGFSRIRRQRLETRRRRILAVLLRSIVLACTQIPAAASHAQLGFQYSWNNPAGGAYDNSANWLPIGVPNAGNEAASFNLNADYDVQMPAGNISVADVQVARGDVTITFPTPPFLTPTYTYTTTTFGVGPGDGVPAKFTLFNGNLTTGAANIAAAGQGVFNFSGSSFTTTSTNIGAGAASTGRLDVARGSRWSTTSNSAVIGGAGAGQLELLAGFRSVSIFGQPAGYAPSQSLATTTGAILGQTATGSGTANVYGIWNTGDLIVGDAGTATVNVLATSAIAPNFTNVSSAGSLTSGTVSIAAQRGSNGVVNLTGQTLLFSPLASPWNISGSLTIGGTSAAAGGAGSVAIGALSTLSVGGDLRLWPGGRLAVNEGPADRINVAGVAHLGGTLEYIASPTFDPQLNDEYEVLASEEFVAGTFATTILPPLDGGLGWSVLYNPTSVLLRVVSTLTADFNGDGDVDAGDLARWRAGFATGTTRMQGDADLDVDVDGADFLAWQRELGSGVPPAEASGGVSLAVPEPSDLAMLLSGAVAGSATLVRRWRRRCALAEFTVRC